MSVFVPLTPDDITQGKRCGAEREAFHRSKGTPQAKRLPPEKSLSTNIDGAIAEIAAANYLETRDWWVCCTPRYGELKGDVWPGVQVRGTVASNGHLLLYRGDPSLSVRRLDKGDDPWHRYILARLHALPMVELVGWIVGGEGMTEDNWNRRARFPCYWVKPYLLNAMEPLKLAVAEERARGIGRLQPLKGAST
jgi:hypothetical protein